MARQKIIVGQWQLMRLLNDKNPDIVVHIYDPDWGSGHINGYSWETLRGRSDKPEQVSDHVANFVKRGFLKFVSVGPTFWQRLIGKKPVDYGYLTPLGLAAALEPEKHLFMPLDRDDYDRRYEPKGMWARQAAGLPPLTD